MPPRGGRSHRAGTNSEARATYFELETGESSSPLPAGFDEAKRETKPMERFIEVAKVEHIQPGGVD